jgi:proteasome lid subunit RPN8/RPN11
MPSRIQLPQSEAMQPLRTSIPVKQAIRWNSPYDGNGLEPLVSVFVSQPAYSRICVHSVSDLKNEVGGVLVGQWCLSDAHEAYIVVEHALPARHTRQGSVYLTFTQDSLVDIHDQIDSSYPGHKIVGWYHTHPSMGIFLSNYDTWLHRNFFPEPWQVALVVEPVSATGGFFIRQAQGVLDPTRYSGFYELDGNHGRSMVYWRNLRQLEEPKGDANK